MKYAAQGVISEQKMQAADMAYSFTRSQKNNPVLVEVALVQRDERVPMLDRADLGGADLCKTDLSGGNLREANLSDAKLEGVYLRVTNCTGATLQNAQLFGAILTNVQFTGANLNNKQANASDFAGLDLVFLVNVTVDVATIQRLRLPVSLIENQQGSSYRAPIVKRGASRFRPVHRLPAAVA